MASRVGAVAGHRPRLLSGHLWTLAGYLRGLIRRPPPASRPFELGVRDAKVGEVRLTGRLAKGDGERLVVILHGIAGSCESAYAVRVARTAEAAGIASLRLNMRGSDRSGEDLSHAGLTDDVHAVLECEQLAGYRSLHLLGYSLGGHVALKAATEKTSPRLASVAAICAPLDLATCASAFDRPASRLYRRRILADLGQMYERVAARRPLAVPPERVCRAGSLREFDGLAVAPRFGFADADDYYRRMSVGPRLERLRVPSLLVVGVSDPLVPLETLLPFVSPPPAALTVKFLDPGGHVGFPASAGLEGQTLAWLCAAGARAG